MVADENEVLKLWKEYFQNLLKGQNEVEEQVQVREQALGNENANPPTLKKVKNETE